MPSPFAETLAWFDDLPSPAMNGLSVSVFGDDEQLDTLWRLDLFALEVAVDCRDSLAQLTFGIGLHHAANGNIRGARIQVPRREQSRHALFLGGLGQFDPGPVAAQPHVAQDQVN